MQIFNLLNLRNSVGNENGITRRLISMIASYFLFLSLFYILAPRFFILKIPSIFNLQNLFMVGFIISALIILVLRGVKREKILLWIVIIIPLILSPIPIGWGFVGFISLPIMSAGIFLILTYSIQQKRKGILISIIFIFLSIPILYLATSDFIADNPKIPSEISREDVIELINQRITENKNNKEIAKEIVKLSEKHYQNCDNEYYHPSLKNLCRETVSFEIQQAINSFDPRGMRPIGDCHQISDEYKYEKGGHSRPTEESCIKSGLKLDPTGCICIYG